jgi:hypothetical protein
LTLYDSLVSKRKLEIELFAFQFSRFGFLDDACWVMGDGSWVAVAGRGMFSLRQKTSLLGLRMSLSVATEIPGCTVKFALLSLY